MLYIYLENFFLFLFVLRPIPWTLEGLKDHKIQFKKRKDANLRYYIITNVLHYLLYYCKNTVLYTHLEKVALFTCTTE